MSTLRRSGASRASAKSLQAQARGPHELRQGGLLIDRAWRVTSPRVARKRGFSAGEGGLERLFRLRDVGGIAPEQHFAARSVQFWFERSISNALDGRQRLVERRDRA